MGIDSSLLAIESKLESLRVSYEKYFLGARPNEPLVERREVERLYAGLVGLPMTNTAQRFRLQSLGARLQANQRRWNETLRKIEAGSYERHLFRAALSRDPCTADPGTHAEAAPTELDSKGTLARVFDTYVETAKRCGMELAGLTRDRLECVLRDRERELRQELGCQRVDFHVVVEDGRVKVKGRVVR